jgi:uncharacterized protein (DUF2249 family)
MPLDGGAFLTQFKALRQRDSYAVDTMPTTSAYDLRPLVPFQRHQLAFQCFDSLAAGEAFELINDHEPRGLLMQFVQQRPNAFDWQVLEAGPQAWRIRVQRLADSAAFAPTAAAGLDEGCCSCSCSGRA